MTLSRVTKWLAGVVLAGYLVTLFSSHHALTTLKVGGALYEEIALGKDLIADILPPPAYLIESYLEASLALSTQRDIKDSNAARRDIDAHVRRLGALEKDYWARKAFWTEQTLEPALKAALLTASYEPGARFWRIVNDRFVPALREADSTRALSIYAELTDVYGEHRRAIDRTVEMANAHNENVLAHARSTEFAAMGLMWGTGLLMLGLIVAAASGVLLKILAPIMRINHAMSQLAVGRNDIAIPYIDREDEIGEMAKAVDVFRAGAIERERLEAEMVIARRMEVERQSDLDKHLLIFKEAITTNIQVLLFEVDELREAAELLLGKADEASQQAAISAKASANAAAGSQAVAAATEQLNASIREIAARANGTSTIVSETTASAQATDSEVQNLLDAVGKIETVVTLIRQIAQHTNLLALNATIESARAGEAGKGFAVVAAEVKALSDQTAKATEEIAEQIHAVQTITTSAAAAVRAIGGQVSEIHHLAASVAASVEEQQAATADIARNVTLVANGSSAAAEGSRVVTEVANLTGTEAKRLSATSTQLQNVSAAVSQAVATFIQAVSADLTERRTNSRFKVDSVLVVSSGDSGHRVRAIDVSETGMKLARIPGIKAGDSIELRLANGPLRAQVVWVQDDSCGVHFNQPMSKIGLAEAGFMPVTTHEKAA